MYKSVTDFLPGKSLPNGSSLIQADNMQINIGIPPGGDNSLFKNIPIKQHNRFAQNQNNLYPNGDQLNLQIERAM